MKTMIPALAGTFLLVPDIEDINTDTEYYRVNRVPIIGWSNYSAALTDAPGVRTTATPIVPYWPEGVTQASAYLIPDDQGGYSITVPFAKRTFDDMAKYKLFAETLIRGIDAEKAAAERSDLAKERREDRDETALPDLGDMITVALPNGTFSVTPAEDTREVGATLTGNSRRSKDEIAADENFLAIVNGLGKTIRAVNTRWKTMPSRTAVLRDLAGVKDEPYSPTGLPVATDDEDALTAEAGEYQTVPFDSDDEDEDLIG